MRIKIILSTLLISIVATTAAFAYQGPYHYGALPNHVYRDLLEYNMIKMKLDKAEYEIEVNGDKAFEKIKEINEENKNFGGIFVIDPIDGKILLTPDIKKNAYNHEQLNGKILAHDAIKEWQKSKHKTFWDDISNAYYAKYEVFFTRVVVSLNGKTYILAAGEKNIDMQRLFVTKIVDKACKLIKAIGINNAFNIFKEKESKYEYNAEIYVFVYDENGVCLFNPNYPELVGKNVPEINVKESKSMAKMIQIAKKQGEGWLKIKARIPGKKQESNKEIFFKSVFSQGKTYIVGSGAYLK